jgi:hypothetical protein
MNVVRLGEQHLGPDNRPAWCEIVGMGVFRVRPNATFDRHFHDSPEYWLATWSARRPVPPTTSWRSTRSSRGFYLEEPLRAGGTIGHQHRDSSDAEGHAVPMNPLPDDFPPGSRAGVIGA